MWFLCPIFCVVKISYPKFSFFMNPIMNPMHEETFDLDIQNYELQDLLELFHLPHDFNESDLKQAKKIVLKMHPDQSRLDAKYFLFFSKAFKIIHSVFVFKNKQVKDTNDSANEKEDFITSEQKRALDTFLTTTKKKGKEFNTWFNEEFEKHRIRDEEEEYGYGEWLKSEEGMMPEFEAKGGIDHGLFEKKKKEMMDMEVVKKQEREEWLAPRLGASNVVGQVMDDYSSELFSSSSLAFQDLKKAYNESIIPVDLESFENKPKFDSVDEYQHYRQSTMEKVVPLSEKQAQEYLANRCKEEEVDSSGRAFQLAKQWEQIQSSKQTFWGCLLKIQNS